MIALCGYVQALTRNTEFLLATPPLHGPRTLTRKSITENIDLVNGLLRQREIFAKTSELLGVVDAESSWGKGLMPIALRFAAVDLNGRILLNHYITYGVTVWELIDKYDELCRSTFGRSMSFDAR